MARERNSGNGDFGLCSGCGNHRCRECGGRRSAAQEQDLALKELKNIARPWIREGKAVGRIATGITKDLGSAFVKEGKTLILGKNNPFW